MDMDILQAKNLVIEAGHKLVDCGLIARTWGNVSARVSDTQFVITPSGRAYYDLTPEDIVLVNIADCSYEGDVKPSSEKGIHASAYELRPETNFVIHTHQVNASAVSALGFDINGLTGRSREIIGPDVPVAAYGMPSTGKLKNGVREAILRSSSKAVIMKHHGAVCLGADENEAFEIASELETVCMKYILSRYHGVTNSVIDSFESIGSYASGLLKRAKAKDMPQFQHYDSQREGGTFKLIPHDGGDIIRVNIDDGEMIVPGSDYTPSVDLHCAVYEKREDINNIIHSDSELIREMSTAGITMKPLLDDFAQLIGVTLRTAEFNPNSTLKSAKKVVRKLKGRDAVMLKDNGALCVGKDRSDAEAVEMVVEKGVKTQFTASLFEKKTPPISPVDSVIMRLIYKVKYSKKK